MDTSEAQAWILIVTTVTSAIVTVITALRVGKVDNRVGTVNSKVDTVHQLVNSAMTQEKAENTMLKAILTAKQIEIDTAEKARIALATAVATTNEQVALSVADPVLANLPTKNVDVPIPVILSDAEGKSVATEANPVHVTAKKKK